MTGARANPAARLEHGTTGGSADTVPTDRIALYGAFTSPWSYLASRRAALLTDDGVHVDWRAVEDEGGHRDAARASARFEDARQELEQALATLLPGERLPYALAGFIPDAGAAVALYADAYRRGAAPTIRRLLFEAFWLHAFDLDDRPTVHALVADALGRETADARSSSADRSSRLLRRQWSDEWRGLGSPALPVLLLDGAADRCGLDAVEWLGRELTRRGVDAWSGRSGERP